MTMTKNRLGDTQQPESPGVAAPTAGGAWRLPPNVSLYLLASVVVSFLASSSAPTPLYAVYAAEWGFRPITTTIVFGVYAITVLLSLLTLGKLSDHVGRRPVLLTALVVQVAAMVLFITAQGVPELLAARTVQGLATGAALGAIGAGMLDIDRVRGTLANSFSPGVGTASGALISALVVQFLPSPTKLIYIVLIAVFGLQAVGVLLLRETVTRKPGALATLRPEISLPRSVRRPVLVAAPVMFAVWALAGLYGSLGPSLVRGLTGSTSAVYGGLSLFILAGVAALAVLALQKVPATRVMLVGILALIAGVGVTLLAISVASVGWFFAGTAIAGVGFGAGFQGGIRTVVPLAQPHERSGVLSLLFVVSYTGMGVPAILAGFLVSHVGGLQTMTREYGIALMVLAAAALIGLLGPRRMAPLAVEG